VTKSFIHSENVMSLMFSNRQRSVFYNTKK